MMAEVIPFDLPPVDTIMGALLRKLEGIHPERDGWTCTCPSPDHDGKVVRGWVFVDTGGEPGYFCDDGCDGETIRDVLFPSSAREQERPQATVEQNPLVGLMLPITQARLTQRPGPRRYFLTDANSGDGVIVAGTVGLLAAEGGSGKSYALMQLGIAAVTGATWFGSRGWTPRITGPVLYLAGEEDQTEASRRLYFCAQEAGVNAADIEALERDLHILPLAGHGVALTTTAERYSGEALPETGLARRVRDLLKAARERGRPYVLVIVDPLSRFAGADVEKDTNAATRFMQVLETFVAPELGGATCFCAHHTRKKGENDDPDSPDSIRGPSSLKDAARWALRFDPAKHQEGSPDLVTVRMVKRNGIAPMPPLVLCRPGDHEGALRVATRDEVDAHPAVGKAVSARESKLDEYVYRILQHASITKTKFRTDLAKAAGNKANGFAAVRLLLADGRLVVGPDGFFCTPSSAGSSRVPEPQGVRGVEVPGIPPLVTTRGEPGTRNPGETGTPRSGLEVPEPGTRNPGGRDA